MFFYLYGFFFNEMQLLFIYKILPKLNKNKLLKTAKYFLIHLSKYMIIYDYEYQ